MFIADKYVLDASNRLLASEEPLEVKKVKLGALERISSLIVAIFKGLGALFTFSSVWKTAASEAWVQFYSGIRFEQRLTKDLSDLLDQKDAKAYSGHDVKESKIIELMNDTSRDFVEEVLSTEKPVEACVQESLEDGSYNHISSSLVSVASDRELTVSIAYENNAVSQLGFCQLKTAPLNPIFSKSLFVFLSTIASSLTQRLSTFSVDWALKPFMVQKNNATQILNAPCHLLSHMNFEGIRLFKIQNRPIQKVAQVLLNFSETMLKMRGLRFLNR